MSSSTDVKEDEPATPASTDTKDEGTKASDDKAVAEITEGVDKTAVDGKAADWADDDEDQPKVDLDDAAQVDQAPEEEDQEEEEVVGGIDAADRTAEVEVLQNDTSTPYYSAKKFEDLGLQDSLMKGLYAMKFNKPSKIQATSLPLIFGDDHSNLIGQAHNGSGKTACFVLGMLNQIDYSSNTTQALCVVPTRELARQIYAVIMKIGRFTDVKVFEAVPSGDRSRSSRTAHIDAHIVVGTPGRVVAAINKREFDTRTVGVFVLDEADEMVAEQNFGEMTVRIKKRLSAKVQTLLFSATYDESVKQFADKIAPNANKIVVKREQLSLDKVGQFYFQCSSADQRFEVLSDIYDSLTIGQSIIFARRRDTASTLARQLRADGHTVSLLTGGQMAVEERDRVIDEFRAGTTKVLITTNVLARGVDIPQVTVVVNYDLPTDASDSEAEPSTYMHRIGRTGRFGRKGIAINFVYNRSTLRLLEQIEKYFDHKITKVENVEQLEEKIKTL